MEALSRQRRAPQNTRILGYVAIAIGLLEIVGMIVEDGGVIAAMISVPPVAAVSVVIAQCMDGDRPFHWWAIILFCLGAVALSVFNLSMLFGRYF